MSRPTHSNLYPLAGFGLLTLASVIVTGFTTMQLLPGGYDSYLIVGLASATGIAGSRTFFSSSAAWGILLGAALSALAVGLATALHTLFVPPPPDGVYKWGNDLSAAVFGGIFVAVFIIPIGLVCSGFFTVLVRLSARFRRAAT